MEVVYVVEKKRLRVLADFTDCSNLWLNHIKWWMSPTLDMTAHLLLGYSAVYDVI